MEPRLLKKAQAAAFDTDERCHIVELSNSAADPELSVAMASVAVGVTTAWHRLADTVERYVMIAGTGRVDVEGLPACDVGPGDVVIIPAGCAQRISHTGQATLVFHAICTPRFTPACYTALE